MSVSIQTEVEQVEVTLAGILPPYRASSMREFIPGLRRTWLVINGERVCELTDDQAAELALRLSEHDAA